MQESLFYGFSLERHVPSDHMPRKIDRFVDLSGTWAHWVGIRPERRFCDEVHLNLAYRWFCRFHDSNLFRQRLETVVASKLWTISRLALRDEVPVRADSRQPLRSAEDLAAVVSAA